MSTRSTARLEDSAACPCAGRNLDKFIQPAVLAVLAEGPLHGYLILQRLSAMPTFGGQAPDATGVYRYLHAMEQRGMVTSSWDLSETGPAKRLFDLTADGRDCLRRWLATLEDYTLQIGGLLAMLRDAAGGRHKPPACGCGRNRRSRSRTTRKARP